MTEILIKLILAQKIKKEDIENALYEICDNVHSSCDSSCPVYDIIGDGKECPCFKNGTAMLDLIKKHYHIS